MKRSDSNSSNSGLTTVGYAIRDYNGNLLANRTTVGVTEILDGNGVGTGTYQAMMTLPDLFAGSIIWDTGTGKQAIEEVNPGEFARSSVPR